MDLEKMSYLREFVQVFAQSMLLDFRSLYENFPGVREESFENDW